MSEVTEKIVNGGRYCIKCGEFLGSVCDPFGRSECDKKCFDKKDQLHSQQEGEG